MDAQRLWTLETTSVLVGTLVSHPCTPISYVTHDTGISALDQLSSPLVSG